VEEGELCPRKFFDLTTEMAWLSVRREEVHLLQRVPGIDHILAVTIIAEARTPLSLRARRPSSREWVGVVKMRRVDRSSVPQ
jgi:transposase